MAKKSVYDIYYDWLLNQVMYYDMRSAGRDYSLLLDKLNRIQFVPVLDKDRNRVEDGKYMRFIFGEESAFWKEIRDYVDREERDCEIKGSCTFLEMLVGLAYRIHEDIFEIDVDASLARWFWMMLENCGLDEYVNEAFDEAEIDEICRKIIERCYEFDGNGGLFPLVKTSQDQRKVEIWYQMQAYMIEKFGC